MDTGWAALIGAWRDFYLIAGAGAAIFAGALFVALALHAEALAGPGQQPLRALAAQALTLFGGVFLAGLLLLAPNPSPQAAAWKLALVGAAVVVGPLAQAALQSRGAGAPIVAGLPALLFGAALLGLAVGLAGGDSGLLPALGGVLLLALPVGAALAWRLLGALARARQALRDEQREAGRDRGLERQVRALAREQRALNRRQQEQARAAGTPPLPPGRPDRTPHG